jgi:hypothetical protein
MQARLRMELEHSISISIDLTWFRSTNIPGSTA